MSNIAKFLVYSKYLWYSSGKVDCYKKIENLKLILFVHSSGTTRADICWTMNQKWDERLVTDSRHGLGRLLYSWFHKVSSTKKESDGFENYEKFWT